MSGRAQRANRVRDAQRANRGAKVDSRRGGGGGGGMGGGSGGGAAAAAILQRLGPSKAEVARFTRIVAKNIPPSVTAVEVRSLFASAGAVSRVNATLGATGAGATYEIDFVEVGAARKALASFDGRALDGRTMSLTLVKAAAVLQLQQQQSRLSAVAASAPSKAARAPRNRPATLVLDVTATAASRPPRGPPKKLVLDVSGALKTRPNQTAKRGGGGKGRTPKVRAAPKSQRQ